MPVKKFNVLLCLLLSGIITLLSANASAVGKNDSGKITAETAVAETNVKETESAGNVGQKTDEIFNRNVAWFLGNSQI